MRWHPSRPALLIEPEEGIALNFPAKYPGLRNLLLWVLAGSVAGAVDCLKGEGPMTADLVQPTKDFLIRFDVNPPAKAYASSFEILPHESRVWNKGFSVRIEQAKASTRPKMLKGRYIDINLSAQILSIFDDGKLLDLYLVSTGKSGMETPRGTHSIVKKIPRAWSEKYGRFMPYWMAITPGGSFGIHELPEWPGGSIEGANDLGIPVSHGCVRLGIGPARRVYDWAEVGTPVVVY